MLIPNLNYVFDAHSDNEGGGEVSPPEIDWSSIDPNDIPDDVIARLPSQRLKTNEYYTQALDEAVQRRQRISELEQTLNTSDSAEEEVEESSSEDGDLTQLINEEVEKRINSWTEALSQELQPLREAYAQQQLNGLRQTLVEENNLTPDAADYLDGETEAELRAQAKALSASGAFSRHKDGSSSGGRDEADALSARVLRKALGEQSDDEGIWSESVQRRMGGGVPS